MPAPQLNRNLTLETPERTPDGAGGFTTTWVVLGQLWAALHPASGGERAREAMTVSRLRWKITLRAAPEGSTMRPKPEQRFKMGARVFRITAVADAPDARFLMCYADEEVSS